MLSVDALRRDYASGARTSEAVVDAIFARIAADGLSPVWISLADRDQAIANARAVDLSLPLAGVPFAVKDNIDVAGMPTTAGCPSFAYRPARSATVVTRLLEAGAVLIGKTNLDQFATGLVGMRSPYGACSSVFDARYISGGSSSGSAVAVATELCAFALGTDTAGSGRVPAAFNGLLGLKPTRGLLSTAGVVPACRSLDCVSIFATTAADAEAVWRVALGEDASDPFSRSFPVSADTAPWLEHSFRFGIPCAKDLDFAGEAGWPELYERAAERLESIGGTRCVIDFTPFKEAAALLYAGPWVAERFVAVGEFIVRGSSDVHPVVAGIIRSSARYSAADAFSAAYQLEALKRAAETQWAAMDVLLLPTAPTIYTKEAIEADPVALNSRLGTYTNFVNLLDLAAVAVPAGLRSDGLPFGVSLIGRAFSDTALLALAARFRGEPAVRLKPDPTIALRPDATIASRPNATQEGKDELTSEIHVAVVGAHLSGQPLNHQLVDRGARLVRTCRTSAEYRLFALAGTSPPKPGLVREAGYAGPGIEVEIWTVPEERFGSFVAAVPPPLAIGTVQLETGKWVNGFVCEPCAMAGAEEITSYGGWRAYLDARGSGLLYR